MSDIFVLNFFMMIIILPQSNVPYYPLQIEFIGIVENFETLLIGIFSIILLLLSISSYKKTRLQNILYAAAAFALFAFDMFLELIIERYYSITYPLQDLLHTSIILAILGLFFMSIVKRNR